MSGTVRGAAVGVERARLRVGDARVDGRRGVQRPVVAARRVANSGSAD